MTQLATPQSATGVTADVVELSECPLCGSLVLEALPVRNLNSRDEARIEHMRERLGGDFFVQQRLSICRDCNFVFQSTRPVPEDLEKLYAIFSETVSKVTPRPETMLEYVLKENSKDYVHMPAESLRILDRLGVLEGADYALEVRTYGGSLLALLRERGIGHVEGAYIQEFDAQAARRMFGIERLVPFSFARPIREFQPERDSYDLIVTYEGLTHTPDPVGFLRWIRDHLSEKGAAVLFREPDTPAYRRYQPLEIVFNNFHMNLLTGSSIEALVAAAGGLRATLHCDYHPGYAQPLYRNVVLERDDAATPELRPRGDGYDASFYRSWIAADDSPRKRRLSGMRRRLTRLLEPAAATVREEVAVTLRRRRQPKS
jgi:hypothetical protein